MWPWAFVFILLAAVGALIYSGIHWRAGTRELRERLRAARVPLPPESFLKLDSLSVPEPVRRYLRTVLPRSLPPIAAARIEHSGRFNLSESREVWRPFHSTQCVVTNRPGFDWDARISMAPGINAFVHDAYVGGVGILQVEALGLLPLAKAGMLDEVATTGITGSTGAGQSLNPTSHFSWRADNISAYKTLEHQHIAEITASLCKLQPGRTPAVHFIPWRGDFTRGIFISSQLRCEAGLEDIHRLYDEYFADHPFTHTTRDTVFLKQVVNTNQCLIQLEKSGDRLVVHSVIDNLLKGASGQAVQNMNLMFGHDEAAGLRLKASYF